MILVPKNLKNLRKVDQYKMLWSELESWLKSYENLSERHKALYDFVNKIKQKYYLNSTLSNNESGLDEQYNSVSTGSIKRTICGMNNNIPKNSNNYDNTNDLSE